MKEARAIVPRAAEKRVTITTQIAEVTASIGEDWMKQVLAAGLRLTGAPALAQPRLS